MRLEFERVPDDFVGDAECGRPKCRICWESHVRDVVLESVDFGLMADLIDQLMDTLCSVGESEAYYKCILNGSWFSSVEILERSLENAKKLREKQNEASLHDRRME